MKNEDKKVVIVPKKIHELTPQGKKYTSIVMVNVRECGLDYMFHRHLINDYQHKAGIKFRQIFEGASIGGMKGRDYSRFIDSAQTDKLSYTALGFIEQLRDIHRILGNKGFSVACLVCVEDYSLKKARFKLNIAERYMGNRLREVLDDLSIHFGYFKQKFY